MRKPLDIVLCGNAMIARDLFMDARDRARADRVAIGWSAHKFAIEYVDREVQWWPVRTAAVHGRGMVVRAVHVDRTVSADALTDDVISALWIAMASTSDGRGDWTFGDRQTEETIQGRRRHPAAAGEPDGR